MDKGGYSPLGHKELDATEQRTAVQQRGQAGGVRNTRVGSMVGA